MGESVNDVGGEGGGKFRRRRAKVDGRGREGWKGNWDSQPWKRRIFVCGVSVSETIPDAGTKDREFSFEVAPGGN